MFRHQPLGSHITCLYCLGIYIELDVDLGWRHISVTGTLKDKRLSGLCFSLTFLHHEDTFSPAVFGTYTPTNPVQPLHCTKMFPHLYGIWSFVLVDALTPYPPGVTLSFRPQRWSDVWCKGGFWETALHLIDLLVFHQQRWELLLSHD